MAIGVATQYYLKVGSNDLSDHVQSMTVTMASEDVDLTAMGAVARSHAPGLRDDRISVTFFQDYASNKVHATLAALVGVAAGTLVIARPTWSAGATDNPSFSGTMVLLGYDPMNATVGDAGTTDVEFVPAANAYLVGGTL